MKNFIFIVSLMMLIACENKVIQYPVSYDQDEFMSFSQNRGKLILDEDNQMIKNYIDSLGVPFYRTNYGFWISNSGQTSSTMAKNGDIVIFDYQVTDLQNQIIYTQEELGNQNVMLGKVDLPRGLHETLQLIEEGDSAIAIYPSFLAYGGYGDRNKIGGDLPLIFKVKILDIQKKQ